MGNSLTSICECGGIVDSMVVPNADVYISSCPRRLIRCTLSWPRLCYEEWLGGFACYVFFSLCDSLGFCHLPQQGIFLKIFKTQKEAQGCAAEAVGNVRETWPQQVLKHCLF